MGGLFVIFWLGGESIITWRSIKELRMPPSPYALAWSSALFVALGALATYRPARGFATLFAGGLDLAILLQVLPGSGTPTAIKANKSAGGWSSIGMAGNTVIIPDGTVNSTSVATPTDPTASGGSGAGSGTSTAGGAAGGDAAQNQAIAKRVIQANSSFTGWDSGAQWNSLVSLWDRESGWLTSATNPSSGAYGIPQSLHGTQGGQGGNEFSASASEGLTTAQLTAANAGNAAAQILWGLNYILAVYGSPVAALIHENKYGWY